MSLDLIICHDTEDVYTPASYGYDEVPKRLAETYSRAGITANFMVIAQRAKVLKERGRDDVIAALRRHCIGVHTLNDALPYDIVEACKHPWAEGLEIVRRMETEAHRTVAQAFDCEPVCLSAHATNEAPQMNLIAREMGLPYMYGYPTTPPLYNFSRVCGNFNFALSIVPTSVVPPYFEGFDDTLADQVAFEARLEAFSQHIDAVKGAGHPAMLIHPTHPFKVYSLDWVDYYVGNNGNSIPQEKWLERRQAGVRTKAQVELALRNFARLVDFIAHHPALNVLSVPEAVKKYYRVPAEIGWLDLYGAAQRVVAKGEVAIDGRFSPAELLLAMAESLVAYLRTGSLPLSVKRNNDCLGPTDDPLFTPDDPCSVDAQTLAGLAQAVLDHAAQTGYLPANVTLGNSNRIGLGSLYRALAEVYAAIARDGQAPERVDLWRFDRQPRIGVMIGQQYASVAESVIVEPNLDMSRVYRYGKLQTWTLAPCWYGD
jgi:hypothetical protein